MLDLSQNPIRGVIPSQLGNLTELQFLGLGSDSDGGMIADNLEWLSRLPSLTTFELWGTNFTKAGLQSFQMPPSLSTLEFRSCQFPQLLGFTLDGLQSFKMPPSLSSANFSNALTSLDLHDNTIHPTVLSWLLNSSTNLVDVTISGNFISGVLPNSFQKMTSLTDLVFSENIVLGNKIPKFLGNLTNLQTLDLSGNNFNETLQVVLESLPGHSLKTLDLSRNQLGGSILDDGKKFPSLTELNLYGNLLEGLLPNCLSRFPNVVTLDLSSNRLTGSLTESIGKLQNLESLDLSNNSLSGVVSELHFQKLSKLKVLDLSSNSLTLSFNSNWAPPFQLTSLSLSSCKLGSKFPSWLHRQFDISHLDISNSGISGAIPHWFSDLTFKLEHLNLSFNLMNSTLPNFPFMSGNDPFVDLSFNQFHGPIPFSLSNATYLHLSNNKFTGSLSFLCDVRYGATIFLDLSNNLLVGSLPDCLGNFTDLIILNLENNELFGVIPRSLGLMHGISFLNLRHNNFSGSLPSSLKDCTRLRVLHVGENNLKGEIPSWIGERLTNLVFLSLKSNRFFGNIPSKLCHLQSIQILDLSMNDISGSIPSCIDNFTSMVKKLNQEVTSISIYDGAEGYESIAIIVWKGVEYEYKKILGLLRIIDLSSNRLFGEIPKEFVNLAELVQLNLSRNNLSGVIPEKIGKLNKLESLDLSHNKLSGNIPVSLAEVYFLQYLDISDNQLSGRIPTSTQLQSFNASAYAENLGLCGKPLDISCHGDENLNGTPPNSGGDDESNVEDGGEWFDMSCLRMGIGVGFAVGFCGVCGNLLLNASWRLAYFRLLDNFGDFLYVIIAVKWATIKRRFSN
ncbi:receptor-like protein EIX2 [Morus notabilis]|uniref:receptor-like protein EIX2 n=1 Tax=Morus notabilis TaxID=981085 RepID=UPI000CED4D2B|nr:receptor-like protein EIX2 [Morus notabilis]